MRREQDALSNSSKIPIMGAFVLSLLLGAGPARANEQLPIGDQGRAKGKAAAHAALDEKAELPTVPPQLPDQAAQATEKARAAPGKNAFGAKGDAVRRAHGQGQRQAAEDAKAARVDAADRAAQGSASSAAKNANADSHAAAGQARAAAAKAKAHPPHPVHP
jgi:hypothetical protein